MNTVIMPKHMISERQDFDWGCILLGSNIMPEYYIPKAIEKIHQEFSINGISDAWESQAHGMSGSNFINVALMISSSLTPETIKWQILRPIEYQLGRIRTENKFSDRTIDLDLVVWNGQIIDEEIWKLPHMAVPVSQLFPCALPEDESNTSLQEIAYRFIKTNSIWRYDNLINLSYSNKLFSLC
jgi:2-amino-4-hydroxy-6-hydroxymethyldihydropteridine diphosphokinase